MIRVPQLMLAIADRVQIWSFHDIYTDEKQAKQAAAKLFVIHTGVVVKRTKENSYIVLYWSPKRSQTDAI